MKLIFGLGIIALSLVSCHDVKRSKSEEKFLSENGLRRNATLAESKNILRVDTGCTAFFIKNTSRLPIVGSARHCFEAEGGLEQWCADGGALYDYQNRKATCSEVVASDTDLDVAIFKLKYDYPVESAYSLATYVPAVGTPMQLIGFPGDEFRKAEATVSENCEITPYSDLYVSTVGSASDLSIPHNCSTWGGNSGGPFVVAGTNDVVGLPGSYSPNYHTKDWKTGPGFGYDGRVAELDLIQSLTSRYSEKLDALGVDIVTIPSFVSPEVQTAALSKEETAFSQDCFANRNDESYSALLALAATTDCVTAARKLSRVSELTLVNKGILDLSFLHSGLFNRNLRALYLQDNAIQSLDGIQSLLQLKLLDVSNYSLGLNAIDSIELLESTKLARLFANHTGFKDLAQIRFLPQIMHLELAGNSLGSLVGLRAARNDLRVLNVADNNLVDLQGIESAPYLSELTATDNQLTSVDDLSQNKALNYLLLANNKISSIDSLKRLPYLQTIDVSFNDFKDKVDIWGWANLVNLSLRGNKISSLNLSANLVLNWINAELNEIKDISTNQNYQLQTLYIGYNRLKTLDGLQPEGLGATPFINVSYNPELADLSALMKFDYIYYLNISNTAVDNLTPLRNVNFTGISMVNIPLAQMEHKTEDTCPKDALSLDIRNFCTTFE